MLYIKQNSDYVKYYTDSKCRFISEANGYEVLLLTDISDEFDGIIDEKDNLHFIIQAIDGELIYLKWQNNEWQKFSILKNRHGRMKISHLRLVKFDNLLCAFYIMEHEGKYLMIKHRFSETKLYEEPSVVGICDIRQDYCICTDEFGNCNLYFKDENKSIVLAVYNKEFNTVSTNKHSVDSDIIRFRALYLKNSLCTLYTMKKQNSTVIIFKSNTIKNEKIISFAVSRNCSPQIISFNNTIYIQWIENGCIMQIESYNSGETFTKAHVISANDSFAKIRNKKHPDDIICDKCAIVNNRPTLGIIKPSKENNSMNNYKPDITNDRAGSTIIHILEDIKADMHNMGKSLDEICEFTRVLSKFKSDTMEYKFGITPKDNADIIDDVNIEKERHKNPMPQISYMGEKLEENIKLFESTDIDEVLPEAKNI